MVLQEGKAPDFELTDKNGEVHSLKDITADFTIVYFYPKDDTPGCTTEAKEFTADLNAFKKVNAVVVGISGGDEKSKTKFVSKYGLKILLLSDPDFSVCTKYGVYGEKTFVGKKYMGMNRTTFVLDKGREIVKVFENVKSGGHSKEVLEFLKSF